MASNSCDARSAVIKTAGSLSAKVWLNEALYIHDLLLYIQTVEFSDEALMFFNRVGRLVRFCEWLKPSFLVYKTVIICLKDVALNFRLNSAVQVRYLEIVEEGVDADFVGISRVVLGAIWRI